MPRSERARADRRIAACAIAALLPCLALVACAKISGLDALEKDDCAGSLCADATLDTGPRGDAAKDAGNGDGDADVETPRTVRCGSRECAGLCCFDDAGAPTCKLDGGACPGFVIECDSHEDCRSIASDVLCCGSKGVSGKYSRIECKRGDACAPICTTGQPTCDDPLTCVTVQEGAPRVCSP